ncbi:MAG: carboxypeptidase regulatory-like domain-containing protein [Holophagaceae bacterium]|nr:carboxypeptidase regulatory-like domain-containing protein [Holophagaceae bacterium]
MADDQGRPVAGATLILSNPVSGYRQKVRTDAKGAFSFQNIPFNAYHLDTQAGAPAGATSMWTSTANCPWSCRVDAASRGRRRLGGGRICGWWRITPPPTSTSTRAPSNARPRRCRAGPWRASSWPPPALWPMRTAASTSAAATGR